MLESLRREYIYIGCIARTLWRMRHVGPDSTRTIADIVEEIAAKRPSSDAVFYQDRTLSYRQFDEGANRIARWAEAQAIKRGEVVALLMENRPEYLMVWIGLIKVGVVAALINTNLRGAALAHCIAISGARHAIVGAELGEAYSDAAAQIEQRPVVWAAGGAFSGARDFDGALASLSPAPIDKSARAGITGKDTALYIFTSGTTGLPKAARFTHMRMLYMMYGFAGALNTTPRDRTYIALPLYHATGGICAVGMALTVGGALILRRKFSAHEFWDDCRTYRATIFQYIGELCRYLLNAPADPRDGEHTIRAISGNGLRPEIWPSFQKRFAIPRIVEFYGATEGNVSMLNYDGTVGAVGRLPRYMRGVFTNRLVGFDIAEEKPVRGRDGFCIECEPDETGEAIGRITKEAGHTFDGYTGEADTKKKILRDAFEKGDAWFRTGDLMRQDKHGYFYFVDRVGDTYRWKGENVSTAEVAETIHAVGGIAEANVYGVRVPGADGKAGMAAMVAGDGFDLARLHAEVHARLPPYARPLFLRLQASIDHTSTFKQRKVNLVDEGFDPRRTGEPIYFDDGAGGYVRVDEPLFQALSAGRIRL